MSQPKVIESAAAFRMSSPAGGEAQGGEAQREERKLSGAPATIVPIAAAEAVGSCTCASASAQGLAHGERSEPVASLNKTRH